MSTTDDEPCAVENPLQENNELTSSGGFNQNLMDNSQISVLGQSSPPQNSNNNGSNFNSYRHSRAYRHFKNPPQPHMCIRTTTVLGDELFINVLSWTRIVIPQEKNDPIPLYGGMRVPPGSPRCPPLCYAVMANPEVLKDSGRHSKDIEDRRAIVELMCDFVEAMNPDVKLTRNSVILKDRDISGELKDVWNAVQAQRDREREQQQQQMQQHYHQQQQTTQQIFPAAAKTVQSQLSQQQMPVMTASDFHLKNDNKMSYMEQNASSQAVDTTVGELQSFVETPSNSDVVEVESAIKSSDKNPEDNSPVIGANEKQSNDDVTDSKIEVIAKSHQTVNNNKTSQVNNAVKPSENDKESGDISPSVEKGSQNSTSNNSTSNSNTKTATSTSTPKKEKLGGFLPNGCIFPRFKNNKHKDKEKEKEKDSGKEQNATNTTKSSNKEKTLLNSLKKVTSPSSKSQQQDHDAKQQYEKNCINLENQMEKLDLNKLDSTTHAAPTQQLKAGGK